MRTITLLLLFGVWSSPTLAQANDATSIIESILDVDRNLADEIKNDLVEARNRKNDLKSRISDNLKNSAQQLKGALSEKLNELREIEENYKKQKYADRKRAIDEWKGFVESVNKTKQSWEAEKTNKVEEQKQKIRDLLNQLQQAYEENKEQKAQEKEKEKEQLRQAWEKAMEKYRDIQDKLNYSSNAQKEREREVRERMRSTLDEIKAVIQQQKAARDKQRQQRRNEYENRIGQIKNDISAQKDDLDALEDELKQKYSEFKNKQNELKSTVQVNSALKESVKASVVVELGDKLQDTLDKVALKEALSQTQAEQQNNTMAVPKASVLDEVTGVSAWQTVTWILLALSILLGIALIAMIFYQVSQRNNYHNLDGSNRPDERTPIARPVISPGYVDDRKLVPAASSGPVVPVDEPQQQF